MIVLGPWPSPGAHWQSACQEQEVVACSLSLDNHRPISQQAKGRF